MGIFDIIILAVMVIGLCFGLYHGFVKELVGTVGFILAALLAKLSIPYALPYVTEAVIKDERLAKVVIWVAVFLILMLVLSWLAALISKMLDAMNIGWMNRLAGGLLGCLKYIIVVYLLIWLVEGITTHFDPFGMSALLSESKLAPMLQNVFNLCCSLF